MTSESFSSSGSEKGQKRKKRTNSQNVNILEMVAKKYGRMINQTMFKQSIRNQKLSPLSPSQMSDKVN